MNKEFGYKNDAGYWTVGFTTRKDAIDAALAAGQSQILTAGFYVENQESRTPDLEMLDEAESHQLLVEWNDTAVAYLQEKCLHELFEAQVEKAPDQRAVPAPADQRSESGYVAPRTDVEERLAAIWADVLKLDEVADHDNFFALGGDSIRSISIVSEAREQGIPLEYEHLFRYQTISEIAGIVSHLSVVEDDAETEVAMVSESDRALLPEDVEEAYPLSSLQLGMVFHNQLTHERGTYHDVFSFKLRLGNWDIEIFKTVLDFLTQKHSILRTSFELDKYSEPLQLVHERSIIPVREFDLTALDEQAQDKWIADWIDEEKRTVFELRTPPLLRIFIHRRGDNLIQYTLSFHHAIIDGWSVASLGTELFTEYAALCESEERSLHPNKLASSFKEAIVAEKKALQSKETKNFWDRYLEGHTLNALPPFLGGDKNGSEKEGSGFHFFVDGHLSRRIHALADELQVPVRTVLLSAHMRVMSVLSGQKDVVTGLISHTRPIERDGERILGLFLNTLPFRQKLKPGSWHELIRETYASELSVTPHRAYPYAQLFVDNGRVPLYESVFDYVNFHIYDRLSEIDNVEIVDFDLFEETDFPFALIVINQSGRLQLRLTADSSRLSVSQLKDIAAYYVNVLEAMAASPQGPHHENDCLTTSERRQLLVEWNATEQAYAKDKTIVQLFEEQVERTPDSVAVVFEEEALSYGQLNERANRLAHYLQTRKVGPDVLVGICVERSLDMIVGLLGILKAGGAYVPLDPAYPQERLAYMIEDAKPALVLTQAHLKDSVSQSDIATLCVDSQWSEVQSYGAGNPVSMVTSANLAYVIYTSGSTGRPKGTLISRESIAQHCIASARRYGLVGSDHVLQFSSMNFDPSIEQIFSTLIVGAKLIMRGEEVWSSETFCRQIQRHRISVVDIPPAYVSFAKSSFTLLDSLRLLIVGGEALSFEAIKGIRLNCALMNAYGPTEATITSSTFYIDDVENLEATGGRYVPIGRPTSNIQIHILDPYLNPVPVGVAGELHIAGIGLARGYLNRPDLTAEKFIPNPFSQQAGARMYKTGDLARYLPDGQIDYLGRIDHQVKIRGFRIELGEIESALNAIEGIREAVVLAREDHPGDKRLVAYVVAQAGHTTESGELRAALMQRLPEYMVPSAFMVLEQMPLTLNGKVDRKALPEPDVWGHQAEYVAPRTEIEALLCRIWQEVLGVARVGATDNFFDLSGHSLLVVRLLAHINQVFHVALPMKVLLTAVTIEAQARALSQLDVGLPSAHSSPLVHPSVQIDETELPEKPAILIVHGAWGGGYAFKKVGRLLQDRGFEVYRGSLTGQGERAHLNSPSIGLDTHIDDVVNTILYEDLHDVVLVGHSYGGMVITGVADRVPDRIRHLVYLDTPIPNDNDSVMSMSGPKGKWVEDTLKDGMMVPLWVKERQPPHDVPHSFKTFTDRISLKNEARKKIPGTFILAMEPGKEAKDADEYPSYLRAKERGLTLMHLTSDHNPERSAPQALAEMLGEVARTVFAHAEN